MTCADVFAATMVGLSALGVFGLGYVFGRLDGLAKEAKRLRGGNP